MNDNKTSESLKLYFEAAKHMTTLNTAIIVIFSTLITISGTKNNELLSQAILAVSPFLVSAVIAVVLMGVLADQADLSEYKMERFDAWLFGASLALFILGIFFMIYTLVNIK